MKYFSSSLILGLVALLLVSCARAPEDQPVTIATGAVGRYVELLREVLDDYEESSGQQVEIVQMPASTTDIFGQFKIWLNAQSHDIDIYQVDVIWAPQIDNHLVDLTVAMTDVLAEHFPSIIESQTVDNRLVALPFFTDAPALYYRQDLLERYGRRVPQTWQELTVTGKYIMDRERAAGNREMWGLVFQGDAYEGLSCNALEWINSYGGGQIIEADGSISVNNPNAARALTLAASWVGVIAPPGVTTYKEEEARGVWQTGNAVFMRNWPYAYGLSQAADSAVRDRFNVAPLPSGGAAAAATLGGWNLALSRYSVRQEAALAVIKYLGSREVQKFMAINNSHLPTIPDLYEDEDILAAVPFFAEWLEVFTQAVPRPSAPTKTAYNEVSKELWSAVHNVLTGRAAARESLAELERSLENIKGDSW